MFETLTDNVTLSFERICRACLQFSSDMNYLFEGTLVEMFRSCSSVEITENDTLPTYICLQCLNQLNKSFNFKQLCIQSDQILRANIDLGYLPTQIYEATPNRDVSIDFQSPNILEADVIFANLPEDDTSTVAQKNAECILQYTAQSDDEDQENIQPLSKFHGKIAKNCKQLVYISDDFPAKLRFYQQNIDLEPECNLIDSEVVNAEIIWENSPDNTQQVNSRIIWEEESQDQDNESSWGRNSDTRNSPADVRVTLKCEKCPDEFPLEEDLAVHMSIHQDDKIQCLKCQKTFSKMTQLKRHIKTHLSVKNHQCPLCDKQFAEAGGLTKHLERHSSEVPRFKCEECKASYSSRWRLAKHIKRTHTKDDVRKVLATTDERKFECKVCQKRFKYGPNLTEHMKLHTGRKPYKCDTCGKEFAQVSNLRLHSRIHGGARPYACSLCKKNFRSSSKRKDHYIAHHGHRKVLRCDLCGKTFLRREGFELHKKLHNGDLSHPCPLCPKLFVSVNVRNRHMEVHKNVKSYSCSVCEEVFYKMGELNKHKKVHKSYNCSICEEVFYSVGMLKRHKIVHKVDKKGSKKSSKTSEEPPSLFNISECADFASFTDWQFSVENNILFTNCR